MRNLRLCGLIEVFDNIMTIVLIQKSRDPELRNYLLRRRFGFHDDFNSTNTGKFAQEFQFRINNIIRFESQNERKTRVQSD